MKLTMNERGAVIKGFAQQCRRAGKKRKGRILDQVLEATGSANRVTIEADSPSVRQSSLSSLLQAGIAASKLTGRRIVENAVDRAWRSVRSAGWQSDGARFGTR